MFYGGRHGGRGKGNGKQHNSNYYHSDRMPSGADRMNQYLYSELESERAANTRYCEREEAQAAAEQQESMIAGVAKRTTKAVARMMGFKGSKHDKKDKKEDKTKSKKFGFTKAGLRALKKWDSSTSDGSVPSSATSSSGRSADRSMRFMSKIVKSMKQKWKRQKREKEVDEARRFLKKHGMPTDDTPNSAPGPASAKTRRKLKLPEAKEPEAEKHAIYQEVLEALSPTSDMTDWPKTDKEWAAILADVPGVKLTMIQDLLKANGLSMSAKTTKKGKICQVLEYLQS